MNANTAEDDAFRLSAPGTLPARAETPRHAKAYHIMTAAFYTSNTRKKVCRNGTYSVNRETEVSIWYKSLLRGNTTGLQQSCKKERPMPTTRFSTKGLAAIPTNTIHIAVSTEISVAGML
jgi:hypothetical protein